jgi:site-specific recombinase XerD
MADINLSDNLLIVRNSKFFKSRFVPIGPKLTAVLQDYLKARRETYGQPRISSVLFLNYRGTALARQTAERYFRFVRQQAGVRRTDGAYYQPRLRHATAVHLLRAGVDINTIRAWLGHVSLDTTNIYAEVDLEMKSKALAHCEISGTTRARASWHSTGLMAFLKAL